MAYMPEQTMLINYLELYLSIYHSSKYIKQWKGLEGVRENYTHCLSLYFISEGLLVFLEYLKKIQVFHHRDRLPSKLICR